MKIRAYLSASIRGKDGDSANIQTVYTNVAKAVQAANKIRRRFKDLTLYCPHDWEHIIAAMMNEGARVEDVLKLDGAVLELCDMIIFLNPPSESKGCQWEWEKAKKERIPRCYAYDVDGKIPLDKELFMIVNNGITYALSLSGRNYGCPFLL